MAIKVVELGQVSPSEGAAREQLLPLVHFNIVRLGNHLLRNLYFYSLECSESHFLDTIVPNLKNSLSLTLKHFLPLAGKIVFPLTSGTLPVSHYIAGDSVSLTIALSDADFVHLTGNHSRDADEFHQFLPPTLSSTCSSDFIKFSVLAIQVTLFPKQGICLGLTFHQAIADGATILNFRQAWASINKFNGGDAHLVALGEKFLPCYNRSFTEDDIHLATRAWNHMKMSRPTISSTISLPLNKVRAMFILSGAEIQTLKKFVLNNKVTAVAHISSFVAVCGHVWSCLAKAAAAVAGEEVAEDDEPEYLTCSANCRARFSPPLPHTYFGNCVVLLLAESNHGTLKGKKGFVAAAQAIGEAIHNFNNRDVFDDLEIRLKLRGKRVLTVVGSPTFDLCGVDYGWGRAKKFESVTGDCNGSVFFCKSREGGVEIGLSMPKLKMDAFAAFFNQGLREATQNICKKSKL